MYRFSMVDPAKLCTSNWILILIRPTTLVTVKTQFCLWQGVKNFLNQDYFYYFKNIYFLFNKTSQFLPDSTKKDGAKIFTFFKLSFNFFQSRNLIVQLTLQRINCLEKARNSFKVIFIHYAVYGSVILLFALEFTNFP